MTALGVLLAGAGAVLIFAGVKGEDVRQLVTDTLTGKRTPKRSASPLAGANAGAAGAAGSGIIGAAMPRSASSTSSTAPPPTGLATTAVQGPPASMEQD